MFSTYMLLDLASRLYMCIYSVVASINLRGLHVWILYRHVPDPWFETGSLSKLGRGCLNIALDQYKVRVLVV